MQEKFLRSVLGVKDTVVFGKGRNAKGNEKQRRVWSFKERLNMEKRNSNRIWELARTCRKEIRERVEEREEMY